MVPMQLHQVVFFATLAACCGYAALRGERPERIGALVNVVATAASMAVMSPFAVRWIQPEIRLFGIDILVTASFYVIALWSDRFWPVWAFAFALVDIATHAARFFFPTLIPHAYAIGAVIWAYPAMLSMVVGTAAVSRRRKSA